MAMLSLQLLPWQDAGKAADALLHQAHGISLGDVAAEHTKVPMALVLKLNEEVVGVRTAVQVGDAWLLENGAVRADHRSRGYNSFFFDLVKAQGRRLWVFAGSPPSETSMRTNGFAEVTGTARQDAVAMLEGETEVSYMGTEHPLFTWPGGPGVVAHFSLFVRSGSGGSPCPPRQGRQGMRMA